MKSIGQVYCIHCDKLVSLEKAAMVFKTGFFKNTYPLGICKVCNEQAAIHNAYLQQASGA